MNMNNSIVNQNQNNQQNQIAAKTIVKRKQMHTMKMRNIIEGSVPK
jgi:hypothetical protein